MKLVGSFSPIPIRDLPSCPLTSSYSAEQWMRISSLFSLAYKSPLINVKLLVHFPLYLSGTYRLAHWPARTAPEPWMRISSLFSLVYKSPLINAKLVGSFSSASACKCINYCKYIKNFKYIHFFKYINYCNYINFCKPLILVASKFGIFKRLTFSIV